MNVEKRILSILGDMAKPATPDELAGHIVNDSDDLSFMVFLPSGGYAVFGENGEFEQFLKNGGDTNELG